MKWIDTTGGSLIMMATDVVEHWNGIQGDYDRACEVYDWLDVLWVQGRQALVVNDEPMETAAWFKARLWLLVRWNYAPDEGTVMNHLEAHACHLVFPDPGLVVDFGSPSAILFDSASSGSEVDGEDCLRLELPGAKCEVRTLDWKPDDQTRLIMHSFRPAD